MAFVYRHYRLDTREVFYVGIGSRKSRINCKQSRNPYWHNIVNKHGFTSEVIATGLSREKAEELECFLISEYGRKDKNEGNLVNMTDGADGLAGYKFTDQKKIQRRNKKIGEANSQILLDIETGVYYYGATEVEFQTGIPRTTLQQYFSNALYNKTKYRRTTEDGIVEPVKKKRKKLSQETLDRMSKAKKGRVVTQEQREKIANTLRGRRVTEGKLIKPIIDIYTGVYYSSAKEVEQYIGKKYNTIRYYANCKDNYSYSQFAFAEQELVDKRHTNNLKANKNEKSI